MTENIINIQNFEEYLENNCKYRGDNMEGFKIITNKQEIICSINNDQSCCEEWGYNIYKFPNELEYSNAEIKNIIYDENNKTEHMQEIIKLNKLYKMNAQYISISIYTNVGILVIMMWNIHNGYYPHTYHIKYKWDNKEINDFDEL